jgi:hypothetical protein
MGRTCSSKPTITSVLGRGLEDEPVRKISRIPGLVLLLGGLGSITLGASGARAQTTDTTPEGMVAFFMSSGSTCPDGWTAASQAQGRLIVGVASGSDVGVTVNDPLDGPNDPVNWHGFSTTLTVQNVDEHQDEFAGNPNGTGQIAAESGDYNIGGSTSASPSNLPYIQLVVCQKSPPSQPLPPDSPDGYPQSTLAFFNLEECPHGWDSTDIASLNGYFLVPFANLSPTQLGATVNSPLSSGEDRQHNHWASSATCGIHIPDLDYMPSDPKEAPVAWPGWQAFSGWTDTANSSVPYVQQLICQKSLFTKNPNPPVNVPQYVVTFFEADQCPTGWKSTNITSGRFITGLPDGGIPQTTFGGEVLNPGEDRQHSHTISGSVTISSISLSVKPGCCWHLGVAATYPYQCTTKSASTGMPYAMVTQCQPCAAGDTDPACQ